jgi:hypothetical protein
MKQNLVHLFGTIGDCTLTEIDKLAKSKTINHFEQKAFSSFCIAAQIAAENLLKLENLPYDKVEKINDLNSVADAYIFLCAVEVHAFLERAKNNKKIRDALSTPKNDFIKHFAMCFGGKEDEDYFNKMLNFFDKVVTDMGDPRDLWYNQMLWFSNKVSGDKIDFTQLTGRELADTITLSLVSQNLRIMSAKLFDKIVFNEGNEGNRVGIDIED